MCGPVEGGTNLVNKNGDKYKVIFNRDYRSVSMTKC